MQAASITGLQASPPDQEYLMKVLLVGEANVGKTTLMHRLSKGGDFKFSTHYKQTIGIDFGLKVIQFGAASVRTQLWDIAGQERYGAMTKAYYREAHAALVVASVDVKTTVDSAGRWKSDLDNKIQLPSGQKIPAILLVNKSDLRTDVHITNKEIKEFAAANGFIACYIISVKENTANHIDLQSGKVSDSSIDGALLDLVKAALPYVSAEAISSPGTVSLLPSTSSSPQPPVSTCGC